MKTMCLAHLTLCASLTAVLWPLLAPLSVVAQTAPQSAASLIARVGDQDISSQEYLEALEQDGGTEKAVLTRLVFGLLVRQAAARKGLMPTSQEVEARLADLERRTPQVLTPYRQSPARMGQFKTNLETQMALENLRMRGVSVTPSEVVAYYGAHKREFVLPTQVQTTLVVTENSDNALAATRLLQRNVSPELIARQPGLRVAGVNGFNPNLQSLSAVVSRKISREVFLLKPGEVQTVQAGNQFWIFRVNKHQQAAVPPLAGIRDEMAREARLQKAISAQKEMAALYWLNPPHFYDEKYKSYFEDYEKGAQR